VTHVFETTVGDTLYLRDDLHGYAFADANTTSPLVNADFAFSGSSALHILSVTNGVELQSCSGVDYTTTVAAPDATSTLGLLVMGFAAMAAARRSRR
jgi:hypothetical protein